MADAAFTLLGRINVTGNADKDIANLNKWLDEAKSKLGVTEEGSVNTGQALTVAGAAATSAGGVIAAGLDSAANAAVGYGTSVLTVQRITGDNAKESSDAAAIFEHYGISATSAGRMLKTLDTAILANNTSTVNQAKVTEAGIKVKQAELKVMQATTPEAKKAAELNLQMAQAKLKDAEAGTASTSVLAQMGIATKDQNGNNRDSISVMADVAEWYSKQTDKTAAAALASKALGRNWQTLLPVLSGGKAGIQALTDEAHKNGLEMGQGQVNAIAAYNKSLADNKSAEEGLTVQTGLMILPFKTFIEDILGKLLGMLNSIPGPIKDIVVGGAALTAALLLIGGPLLMIVGMLPTIATGFGILTGALGTVGAAFSAEGIAAGVAWLATLGPIALVIAAVVAVGVAAYEIITHWSAVKDFFSGLWTWLKDFIGKWGTDILAVLVPFIGVPLLIAQHWGDITTFLGKIWDDVKVFIGKWGTEILVVLVPFIGVPLEIAKHWNVIGPWLAGLWNHVVAFVKIGVNDAIVSLDDIITWPKILYKHWGQISGAVVNIWDNVKSALGSAVQSVWDTVTGIFKSGVDTVVGFLKSLPDRALAALKSLASALAKPIADAVKLLNHLNPFEKHSPSLVDNVLAGVDQIKAAYMSISDLNISAPTIGGITSGGGGSISEIGGGGNTAFNLTINTTAPTEDLLADFAVLQSLSAGGN